MKLEVSDLDQHRPDSGANSRDGRAKRDLETCDRSRNMRGRSRNRMGVDGEEGKGGAQESIIYTRDIIRNAAAQLVQRGRRR